MSPNGVGYFAIDRGIFRHPLLKRREWFWAWQWLVGNAAWKDEGTRVGNGTVALKRGQMATTVRGLADLWDWPKSNVEYFLIRLEEAGMIGIEKVRTKIQTKNGAKSSVAATVITVCNYDKFQRGINQKKRGVGQRVGQGFGQEMLDLPELSEQPASQQLKQTNNKIQESGARANNRNKPAHGAKSRDGKWIWFDHDTSEWDCHAEDYRNVRNGAEILPESRVGGRGNWFVYLGEAMRPKQRRRA